jgi:Cys-tRNA(Pro)/Cys-tRNA(Cys) deacylase
MAKATPATRALDQAKVAYDLRTYDYDPEAPSIGLQAAMSLGEPPARVLKTLIAKVDTRHVCVILASDREVSMKALAAACNGKSAEMAKPADAERMSGYRIGGVSPFGQKKPLQTVLDQPALEQARVFVNGGQRGLQIELDPREILRVLGAMAAAIS